MAGVAGFEPANAWVKAMCLNRLATRLYNTRQLYNRWMSPKVLNSRNLIIADIVYQSILERHMGLEPTTSAWKANMLPLHQWRISKDDMGPYNSLEY